MMLSRNNLPLVSVLVTAYNREKYIGETIDSILKSSFQDFEIIIVDDASTDGTFRIAQEKASGDARILVYRNENNLGQFANRNRAASLATGKYIKYIDSDDTLHREGLEKMVEAMETFNNAVAASELQGAKESEGPQIFNSRELLINHYFRQKPLLFVGPSGSIFRKDVFQKLGGFDEQIGILADTLLMLKIACYHNIVGVCPGTFHWRRHDEQVTVGQENWLAMQKERFKINTQVLSLQNLPLEEIEVSTIRQNLKNILVRNILQHLFKTAQFSQGIKMIRFANLSLSDFKNAFKSNKKLFR